MNMNVKDLAEKISETLTTHWPGCNFERDEIPGLIEALLTEAFDFNKKVEQEKLNRVLDFCKAACEDAIYSEDGLDGDTGQAVIKMIEDAKKGLAEKCQNCELYSKEAVAKEREACAKVAETTKMEQVWDVSTAQLWLAGKDKIAAQIRRRGEKLP